jgi:vitamin B12 transporter
MLKRLLITFLFFTSIQIALANTTPILVITPSGYETPLNKSGSSVYVISASEIEASGFTTVSEILNTVPGINAVTAGFGGTAGLFSRGHDSDMTKIMLDGIDLNDPSAFGTTPVLATLMLNNIEQIEIVLGPQSLIAGADAMGGVINIITKKNFNTSEVSAYTGSNGTSNASSNLGFVHDGFQVNLNINEFQTKGINVRTAGNDDLDGFNQSSISFNLSKDFEEFNFDLSFRNEAGRVEFDESVSQTISIYADNDYTFLKAGIDFDLNSEASIRLEFNKSDFDRLSYGRYGTTAYYAQVEALKLNSKYNVNQNNTAFIGVETKSENYNGTYAPSSANSVSEVSYFVQNEFKANSNTTLLAGLRIDDNQEFGTHGTYRLTANHVSQQMPGLIFKSSIGTGFRAPTLGEMYGSAGNTNLKPEMSFGYDLGFINYMSNKITFGSTYFMSEIEDAITYGSPYYNANDISERDGIETFINFYPNNNAEIKISHTHLMTDEEVLVRRPNNTLTVAGNYRIDKQLSIFGNLNAIEEHFDVGSLVINSYEVINLGIDYSVNNSSSLNLKINNVTGEDYEQIAGYPGLPRQVFLGLNYKF